MVSYTEEEIRRAWGSSPGFGPSHVDHLLNALKVLNVLKGAGSHVHDFTDSDTVTVKEIREAWSRPAAMKGRAEDFLRDISGHREPEYPPASVWKDNNGMHWLRTSSGTWLQFGKYEKFPHDAPSRPLRRMDVMT